MENEHRELGGMVPEGREVDRPARNMATCDHAISNGTDPANSELGPPDGVQPVDPRSNGDSDGVPEKLCKNCSTVKPHSEFYVNRKRPDGLQFYCKLCQRAKVDKVISKREDAEFAEFCRKHGIVINAR